jgi:hypothetical protein
MRQCLWASGLQAGASRHHSARFKAEEESGQPITVEIGNALKTRLPPTCAWRRELSVK